MSRFARQLSAAQRQYDNASPAEQPEGILGCPNETGTWLAENMAETVQEAAIEAIGDFITSWGDKYDEQKLLSAMKALAEKCKSAIREWEMEDAA